MSKKKRGEQTMELNDAVLEATSGGTIMRWTLGLADGTYLHEWAATTPDGSVREGYTNLTDAMAFNSGKASTKSIKAMEKEGWTVFKPNFD